MKSERNFMDHGVVGMGIISNICTRSCDSSWIFRLFSIVLFVAAEQFQRIDSAHDMHRDKPMEPTVRRIKCGIHGLIKSEKWQLIACSTFRRASNGNAHINYALTHCFHSRAVEFHGSLGINHVRLEYGSQWPQKPIQVSFQLLTFFFNFTEIFGAKPKQNKKI